MHYTLIVHGAPEGGGGSHSALRFAAAAIRRGHHLRQVFFYHEGVGNALGSIVPPQDEADLPGAWRSLAAAVGIDLVVCIAAASRRGVLDPDEAQRLERFATLTAPFRLAGLGQLVEAILESDRCLTFVDCP